MSLWSRFIFPIGLLLVAHSVYLAVSIRDELQEHHHGVTEDATTPGTYFPITSQATKNIGHINISTISIFVELIIGVLFSIFGYIKQSSFKRARLIDKNSHQRYDDIMFAGIGFMNFNHRGAVVGNPLEKNVSTDVSDIASKKKE